MKFLIENCVIKMIYTNPWYCYQVIKSNKIVVSTLYQET